MHFLSFYSMLEIMNLVSSLEFLIFWQHYSVDSWFHSGLFPDRECFTLVRPLNNKNDLQHLDDISVGDLPDTIFFHHSFCCLFYVLKIYVQHAVGNVTARILIWPWCFDQVCFWENKTKTSWGNYVTRPCVGWYHSILSRCSQPSCCANYIFLLAG